MSGWMAWAAAAGAALEAYEADYGERLPDDHELGRIDDSRGSPSFRIRVGHIRQISAAPDLAEAVKPLAFSDPENPPPGVAVEDWRGAVLAARAAQSQG